MTITNDEYAGILENSKILYMPSCLIIEMMTKLYSQVSMINVSGNVGAMVPDLLVLLRRLNGNLRSTAEAYERSRIKFFIGDWKHDKLRARKLFFNLMSRLGYLCEIVGAAERRLMYADIEDMGRQWSALDRIMERKCDEAEAKKRCGGCRYFRSEHPSCWKQIMANILLSLDGGGDYDDPGTYLILLCYRRIKTQIVKEIAAIEHTRGGTSTGVAKFSPDKILCVSDEDLPISCPKCMLMTDSRTGTDVIRNQHRSATTQKVTRRISLKRVRESPVNELRNRYLMPATLADITHGKR